MKAEIFNIQKFSLHDGPGIRTSVFFSGCNLHCAWCANPECQLEKKQYTMEELLALVLQDLPFYQKSGGGVTLTGGEVLLQAEFAAEFCRQLRARGVHTALETAGAAGEQVFQSLVNEADFVFMDMKHYDSARHAQGTGLPNEAIVRNLTWLVSSGKDYCIRIPVIPGFNNAPQDARGFAELFRRCGVQRVELLPFHQLGEGKYEKNHLDYAYAGVPQLKKEDLADFRQILARQVPTVILK